MKFCVFTTWLFASSASVDAYEEGRERLLKKSKSAKSEAPNTSIVPSSAPTDICYQPDCLTCLQESEACENYLASSAPSAMPSFSPTKEGKSQKTAKSEKKSGKGSTKASIVTSISDEFCDQCIASCCVFCEETFVVLTTDSFAGETSWDITDSSDSVVAELPQGGQASSTTVTYEVGCLDTNDCYDFTVYDSFGDGFCCSFGVGDYTIEFGDTTIPSPSGGAFGFSETVQFGSCARRLGDVFATVPQLDAHTVLLPDGTTVEITISVPSEEAVAVHVIKDETGEIVTSLFDSVISASSPETVQFNVGNIHELVYDVLIIGESKTVELKLVKDEDR